jgi:hypothetical protein
MPERRLEHTRDAYRGEPRSLLPPAIYRIWTDDHGVTHRDYDAEATNAQAREWLRKAAFDR